MPVHSQLARVAVALCLIPLATRADSVDDLFRSLASRQHAPGIALVVVDRGRIARSEVYGQANIATHQPIAIDTGFKIASLSKQFLASALVLLAADGRLSLDDSVRKFLPDAPPPWQPIAIRRVLSHTAGFEREPPAFNPKVARSDIALIRSAYPVALPYPVGDRWAYSNLGYTVAAEIITRVSGEPWPQYLSRRIFRPLGMASTVPTNTAHRPASMAQGYSLEGRRPRPFPEALALRPAGAFISTLHDLSLWLAALDTDFPLNAAARAQLFTPVRLAHGESTDYGLGWFIHNRAGHLSFEHSGTLGGFQCYLARFPQDHLAFIVFANGEPSNPGEILWKIAATYLPGVDSNATHQPAVSRPAKSQLRRAP